MIPWSWRYVIRDNAELGTGIKQSHQPLVVITGRKTIERAEAPCSRISSRKVDALVEILKEFAADSELQSEVVFCPRDVEMIDTLEYPASCSI